MKMFKYDERYICASLCNKDKIDDFIVLLTFYNEIARIGLKTKNSHILQIRLQWFIDVVKDLYLNKFCGVHIVDNLLPLIKKYDFKLEEFISIIEARNIEKDYIAFKNISEYIKYCKKSSGLLWQMVARMYGASINEEKAAYLSGVAFGIIGNIRNFSFNAKNFHYKLVFNKQALLKNKSDLNKEVAFNVQKLLKIASYYIKGSKKLKVKIKIKRLLLLNVFTEGYANNIKKNLYIITSLNPYIFPLRYKIRFIIKYILNTN